MNKIAYYSGTEDVQWFPEAAATQDFKAGMFVYLASGKLTKCGDNPAAILGLAMADASGTTNTWLPVLLAHSTTLFVGKTTDDGGDVTVDIGHLCIDCEYYVSSNTVLVNVANTSSKRIRTVALHPDHVPISVTATVANATNAKMIFKVINSISQATDKDQ